MGKAGPCIRGLVTRRVVPLTGTRRRRRRAGMCVTRRTGTCAQYLLVPHALEAQTCDERSAGRLQVKHEGMNHHAAQGVGEEGATGCGERLARSTAPFLLREQRVGVGRRALPDHSVYNRSR